MIKCNQLPVQVDPVMRAAETINPVPIGTKHANSHELLVGQPGKRRVGDRLQSIAILNRSLHQLGRFAIECRDFGGGDTDQFGFATDCKRGCIEDRVDGPDASAPAAILRSACNRLRF